MVHGPDFEQQGLTGWVGFKETRGAAPQVIELAEGKAQLMVIGQGG